MGGGNYEYSGASAEYEDWDTQDWDDFYLGDCDSGDSPEPAKFVYIIYVGERTCKIGSCNPTLKHLKARLTEAKRWVPNARLMAVKLESSIKEERQLHKEFKAVKEVVTNWDKHLLYCTITRFSLHAAKKCLSISNNILPSEVKVPEGCTRSSYCQNDDEFFTKIEIYQKYRDRLEKIQQKMINRGWLWIDVDEYGCSYNVINDEYYNLVNVVLDSWVDLNYRLEQGAIPNRRNRNAGRTYSYS